MNCQQAQPLLDAYGDGELEAGRIHELEQHLQTCAVCASMWRNGQSLKKTLRSEALHFPAPAELRRRIQTALPSPVKAATQSSAWLWNRLTTALSGAFAICLALLWLVRSPGPQPLRQEIVSSHIRSLMANHAMDVASTDQHTVKPWFNGKLDFSPPVKNLTAEGFPLVGGRLDYLAGRGVAALIFQRQKHLINLFIWPANEADSKAAVVPSSQGYNLIHWTAAGMTFWAISDLNKTELLEFVQHFAAASPLR